MVAEKGHLTVAVVRAEAVGRGEPGARGPGNRVKGQWHLFRLIQRVAGVPVFFIFPAVPTRDLYPFIYTMDFIIKN